MYRFVIHEHNAKKAGLHYDLRLQFKDCKNDNDICLLSFASRKLKDFLENQNVIRILLFRTEDHEKWWLDFEGELTTGYGAGIITIYDKGIVEYDKFDLRNGIIKFKLNGEKIKSKFALIKTSYYDNKKNEEWLLVKVKKA